MADSNIYLATTNNEHYLINPIDWTDTTGNGVKDNSIPGSKIKDASIPSSKIVGGVASEDTYAREQLLLKQNINDESLKTTNKTIVGAINEIYDNGGGGGSGGEAVDTVARNRTQNIDNVSDSNTHFKGTLASGTLRTPTLNFVESISSDGNIPININAETLTPNIKQIDGDINVNASVSLGNKYYEPLSQDNGFRGNTNGALGWYAWKRVFIDENDNEVLPDSNITINNVKLKYAPSMVLISNNILVKFSDWQYFQKAFYNRSVVMNATKTTSSGRSNYVVKYYQLTSPLKVTKVGDLYQFTYSGVSYTVTHVSNYKFKATSTVEPSKEVECIAQVKTLDELVNDANFAVIVPDETSSDGTYTINFSMPTSDDHFSDEGPNIKSNITSNNGKSTSDANFIPTLNWNAIPTVANINKCKLYLSNKQATIDEFSDNELPESNLPNLFENLKSYLKNYTEDNYTEALGDFSYTQNSHYTSNLSYVSHEYEGGYNTMTLEYKPQSFGDSSNTNIVKLFDGEYGDENNNIRSWDTSLRVTTKPELGCVQIFNFSYAEGFGTVAAGGAAHAEGKGCKTYEDFSHVEGSNNVNIGYGAHVEGWDNTNFGYGSHVEGQNNLCTVNYGHVEGQYNTVNGSAAHAEGYRTIASGQYQHVCGKYNIEDTGDNYAFIIGNGTTNERRSNAFTVDWNGNLEASGSGSFFTSTKITNPNTTSQLFISNNRIQINNSEEQEGFKISQANSQPFEFQTTGNSFNFKPNYSQGSNRYFSISSNLSNAYGVRLDSYSLDLSSETYVKLSTGSHNTLSLDAQSFKISTQGNDNIIINKDGTAIPGTINIQFQVDTTDGNKVTPIFTFTGV